MANLEQITNEIDVILAKMNIPYQIQKPTDDSNYGVWKGYVKPSN